MEKDSFDQEIHPRCPPLGGPVPFRHCRTSGSDQPCARMAECWWDRPDILHFAAHTLLAADASAPPLRSRWEQLLAALERSGNGR